MKKIVRLILLMCISCVVLTSCGESEEAGSSAEKEPDISANGPNISTNETTQIPQYMNWQYAYADRNSIPLKTFKGQQKISEWLLNQNLMQEAGMRATESKGFLTSTPSQYKLSTKNGDFYYRGEVKNNYPDGIGMLTKQSTSVYQGENIVYIGEFKEGRFHGYGMLFSDAASEEAESLLYFFPDGTESEKFDEYYRAFVNYVTYEGNFKNGKRDGEGNSFNYSLYYSWFLLNNVPDSFDPEAQNYVVTVGEYKDDKENGTAKEYIQGHLYYDGTMKDGEWTGEGTQYSLKSGIPIYSGEWKSGKYHGEGTLYDESGNEIYHGEWKNGDLGDRGSGDYQEVQRRLDRLDEQFWQGVEDGLENREQEKQGKQRTEVSDFIATMDTNTKFLSELGQISQIENDILDVYLRNQGITETLITDMGGCDLELVSLYTDGDSFYYDYNANFNTDEYGAIIYASYEGTYRYDHDPDGIILAQEDEVPLWNVSVLFTMEISLERGYPYVRTIDRQITSATPTEEYNALIEYLAGEPIVTDRERELMGLSGFEGLAG